MKTTRQQLTTMIAGMTSILSLQLLGVLFTPQPDSFESLKTTQAIPFNWFSLPANAEPNTPRLTQVYQKSIARQSTRSRKQYFPPLNPNPRRTQGSGARGCEKSLPGDLVTLLIPSKDYAGQTLSGHPTFSWYLSQPISVPLQFTLVELGVPQPLFEKQIDSPQVGMMQIELPKDKPELLTGRVYKWSISLVCNSKRPSANPLFISWIERISPTPELEQQLAAVTSNNNPADRTLRNRAWVYAQWGLWYDAIHALSEAKTANPNEMSINDEFFSLLEQVGLTHVAEQEQQSFAKF
ncbi:MULTISPECIES: DUF928 domain-containing protein [unclassified Coleofasciculus]|uniref:DUF928 domain-containing protein n=1 Tax=unclassified Coleofasciculus TaxID=2692782 RepID=UPI001880CF5B|nr:MULTISPECIES: DUF928 domain-containing protein [unclassified Coleofasciculus]MBE9129074.1 DUF928 domain-containing protein [Coleofasciculus sp. LEGE 07081]MBE9151885.1 DUF928 domain-containing protein [Coleofasciculus sp. LEGE 07092]